MQSNTLFNLSHYLQRLKEVCGAIFTFSLQSCPGRPLVVISPSRIRALELHLHVLLKSPAIGSLGTIGVHTRVQWVQPREEQRLHVLALGLGGRRACSEAQGTALFQGQVLHLTRDAREHGQTRGPGDQILGIALGSIALVKQIVTRLADLQVYK